MTLLDLPHGKTQINESRKFNGKVENTTPTQNATTTQEIYSQETEEEQPQMEVTETAAEPEVEQEEADQMRDTDVGSAALATPSPAYAAFDLPPGWEQ